MSMTPYEALRSLWLNGELNSASELEVFTTAAWQQEFTHQIRRFIRVYTVEMADADFGDQEAFDAAMSQFDPVRLDE